MKKILVYILVFLIAAVAGVFFFIFYPKTPIITGFAAHSVCSCHFIANREQLSIEQNDNDIDVISRAKNTINNQEKSVTSSIFGFRERKAVYRKGLGCVLLGLDGELPENSDFVPTQRVLSDTLLWPYGKKENSTTVESVQMVVNQAFDRAGEQVKKTRAVVVVHKGKIIGEQYAPGFDKDRPLLGWSMSKSLVNAMYGVLALEGRLDIQKPVGASEWKGDPRAPITYNNLLQMNSGLEWAEDYGSISDATKMLFKAKDVSKAQLHKPLGYPIGEHWVYSSGTTNLLCGLLKENFDTPEAYLDFPYKRLFNKLGMTSMVLETDLSGCYIGSSYGWATPRDWAKFGLLYLNDGIWDGERILPQGWVKYTATPAKGSDGDYGAQFWLNAGGAYPQSPKDMYYCDGFQGQYVYVLPSQDLVIVRMGLESYPAFDADGMIAGIINSLKSELD